MVQKMARYAVLAGIFLTPLIPFFVAESMFFPYITGKNFAFRIITEIMVCAWLVLCAYDSSYRPKRSWIFWGMGMFLAIVTIADLTGAHPMRSFWSNFERMEGLLALLHLGAYLLVVGSVMRTEKLWERFFNLSILASVSMCLHAFAQVSRAADSIRVDGTLGNSTYLAVYLLFHIFLSLLLAYRNRDNKMLIAGYFLAIVMHVVTLLYTGTRGTVLGLLGGLFVAALVVGIRGKNHPSLRRLAFWGIGGVLVLVGTFFVIRHTPLVEKNAVLSRLASISLTETTVQSRVLLWTRIGWEGFKERPLLGWGQDNFIVVFGKHYDPLMYKQEPWFDRAHNVFVDWLIAGGMLGLAGYLLLFAAGLWALGRSALPFPEKALLTGLFAAYFIHNLFVFDNLISYIYFATLLAYLHARTTAIESPTASVRREAFAFHPSVVGAGAVVLALGLIYFLNAPYIARARGLIDALTLGYGAQHAQALARYDALLSYGGIGLEETKEQLSQSAIRVWGSDAMPELKSEFVQRARTELAESVESDPENTRPRFFLGYLLSHTGSPEEGIAELRDALAINPSRQNFLYEIARSYLAMGRFEDAAAAFKQAYEYAPDNEQALVYYAGTLISGGKVAEGEQALIERLGTTTVDNDILFNAYVEQKRWDRAAAILRARLATVAPEEEAKIRISLALMHLEMNDRAGAIAELERAIAADAAFTEQGTQMIEAIRAGRNIRVQQQ